ncbi:MAG TPA: T9SS type A sorting domain-containing protein [Bacteroidales bacterium]|nr:T9SS type A sorting domain-containing protein [Bacteroidales bacterium]
MRNRWKTMLCLLLLSGVTAWKADAQQMIIQMDDGAQNPITISMVQNMGFSSGDLVVLYRSGASDQFPLSGIRKLVFDGTISVDEKIMGDDQHLTVYPNPASGFVTVKGIPVEATSLSIFNPDGRRVMTVPVTSNETVVDISQLHGGLYLVKTLGRTSKFIKP